ncbi:MAG: DMT family transporter [Flavobacteriaceae bacterium]|nr:DMT family transporter [Flavobacteriaceae bacterium]
MIYILLSILFSSGLFVIFKLFNAYKIDTLKAIVVNYIVAFILGFANSERKLSIIEVTQQKWIYGALLLGVLFISVFFVMAKTAQNNGVSVASVAGKMSVVIPVFFGVFLYSEKMTALKLAGIVIALIAVYLASVKKEKRVVNHTNFIFPILLFIGSGAIDTIIKYVEINYVPNEEVSIFSGTIFCIAAFLGILISLYKNTKEKSKFEIKNILAGVVLGVPNYFSIIFLIKALQVEGFESSTLFTINNVGIVISSTLIGLIFFNENLSVKNIVGVFLAIFGILIVSIA